MPDEIEPQVRADPPTAPDEYDQDRDDRITMLEIDQEVFDSIAAQAESEPEPEDYDDGITDE